MKYIKKLKIQFLGIFKPKITGYKLQVASFAKRYNILNLILFVLILISTASTVNSQTSEQTLIFADNQFNNKNYEIALEHYKRVLFFEKEQNNFYIYNQIANIYNEIDDYGGAIKYYDLSLNSCKNDSMKFELIFKKANCYILLSDFNYALIDLYAISDSLSPTLLSRKHFYLGVCFYGLENYKSAEKYFIKSLPPQEESIKKLFENENKFYRPNPKTAVILSFVFPGAGQIYAGDTKDGINSFLLSSLIATATVYIASAYAPIDAISLLPWFTRFYQGGIYNAKETAERKRQENRNEIFNKILKEMQTTSPL